jgi:uncharacterized protein (TIGR04255 family)
VSEQPYKRPPITEAVIEIRFVEPVDAADIDKASADFASLYPLLQTVRNVDFKLEVPPELRNQPTAHITREQVGHRRSSADVSEILWLAPPAFAVSQLAPYPGWDDFFARFVRDWKVWKRVSSYRKISRVGVRYINRIDIPITDGLIEESEYLNVYPQLPDALGSVTGYGVQAQLPIPEMGCNLIINSAAVPSPILGCGSFMLDFAINMEGTPPQNDENIYELLNRIRVKKNAVFEACVTDHARELFQK